MATMATATDDDQDSPPATRIVRKLALRGEAHATGARYRLYLRVQLPPASTSAQTQHTLFPDAGVRLLRSSVDPLSASGGYYPLSETAVRAAEHLGGVPIASHSDSPGREHARQPPKVSIANYAIVLLEPSRRASLPAQPQTRGFLVTLELETTLPHRTSPRSCRVVRLPVPKCLHSRIRFAFAPDAIDHSDEVDVRVVPPLGGGRRPRRGSSSGKSRRSVGDRSEGDTTLTALPATDATDEDDEESGDEERHCIRGLFPATDQLTIRWASAGAGKLQPEDDIAALFCDGIDAVEETRYSQGQRADGPTIKLDVVLKGTLTGVYSPGPDPILHFPISLETFSQGFECHNMSIEESPGLRSWHFLDSGDVPRKHPLRSASDSTIASEDLATDDADSVEADDLMSTKPPRGLSDVWKDFSIEFEDTQIPQRPQSTGRPPLTPSDSRRIVMYVDAAQLQEDVPFHFTLRCTLSVPALSHTVIPLPCFLAPTAGVGTTLHHLASHDEGLAPLDASAEWRPTRQRDGPVRRDDARSLSFSTDYRNADIQQKQQAPQCYLRLAEAPDHAPASPHSIAEDVTVGEVTTPQAVYRPQPVYDSINLQPDGPHAATSIMSAALDVFLWHAEGGSEPAVKMLGELTLRWAASETAEDELDVWLPKISGRKEPKLHHATSQGRLLEPSTTDAGDSLCLHVQRARFPSVVLDRDDTRVDTVKLSFQYDNVLELGPDSVPRSSARSRKALVARAGLHIPIPFFAHEVVRLDLNLRYATGGLLAAQLHTIDPAHYDIVQRGELTHSPDSGQIRLHKFSIPALSPLDLRTPPLPVTQYGKTSYHSPPSTQRRRWSKCVAGTTFLGIAAAVLLLAMLCASLSAQEAELNSLHRRVEQLAMAANVDFRDGMWGTQEGEAEVRDQDLAVLTLGASSGLTATAADIESEDVGLHQESESRGPPRSHGDAGNPSDSSADAAKANSQTTSLSLPLPRFLPLAALRLHTLRDIRLALSWPLLALGQGAARLMSLLTNPR
ncbi:unnamed protein product [Parajaminaea phylloscopi]